VKQDIVITLECQKKLSNITRYY